MKKITITTAILIAGTILVNAETEGQKQPRIYPIRNIAPAQAMSSSSRVAPPKLEEGRPVANPQQLVTTGDSETDAKIKALVTEMETKIKAIRDEYQTKIKTVIGTRKVIAYPQEKVGKSIKNDSNNAAMRKDEANDSSTEEQDSDESPSLDSQIESPEVKGANTEAVGQAVGQDVSSRMKSFFGSFFRR